jgi:hypothetical protein
MAKNVKDGVAGIFMNHKGFPLEDKQVAAV